MSGAQGGRVMGWLLPLILLGSAQAQETRMVPVTTGGQTVRLAMRVYKPAGDAPAPTLVFNHESTRGTLRARWAPSRRDVVVVRRVGAFYPMAHGRESFAAFQAARGTSIVHAAVVGAHRARRGLPNVR